MRWRPIPQFPSHDVSDTGCVRSRVRTKTRVLRLHVQSRGYHYVGLWDGAEARKFRVHSLVWLAFRGPIPDGLQINHIDGVKTNNTLTNLEAVTPSENVRHAIRLGLRNQPKGENSHGATLRNKDVLDIRRRHARGEKVAEIAAKYGRQKTHIWNIVYRNSWRHL